MAQQFPNCPDKQRAKVPHINLTIKDMANPCELAEQFDVPLSRLRAFQIRDPVTREMLNDFAISRDDNTPQLFSHTEKP
jgi:hypothetical protein